MKRLILCGALAGALACTALALAQEKAKDATVVSGEAGRRLDQIVKDASKDFWGSVLVASKGKVALAKGYGFQDYKSVAMTPLSLFEIASTSKHVTAAAILRLEQDGKLKTTDAISKFFPGLPAAAKDLTVHQFLTHTSGMSGEVGLSYGTPVERAEAVKSWFEKPLASKPGERFEYANAGYALLAAIVEVASGEKFEDYVRAKLFVPAGLTDTGFIKDGRLDAKRATTRKSSELPGTAVDWFWGWGYRGMGGVVTTVNDLHKWDRALRGEKVLKKKALEKYFTPEKDGYAYGWLVEKTERGTTKVHHGGAVAGYRIQLARYLEDDVVIAVLTNDVEANDPRRIELKLAELVFAK